jgi:hypothetical protein
MVMAAASYTAARAAASETLRRRASHPIVARRPLARYVLED